MTRDDVQLPKDADESEHREHDDEAVGEAGIDVGSEEERERADADDAGDAVQRLHLDQEPEHPEREQQSADDRIGGKARDCFSPAYRTPAMRGASAEMELRERGVERRRGSRTRSPRAPHHRVLSVRIAPGRLYCGRSTFLSTIAPAMCAIVVRCARAVDSNSPRSAEMVLTVAGIGSAAPIDAPGAMTMRLAESEISAAAE